jgi:hypothetical protein
LWPKAIAEMTEIACWMVAIFCIIATSKWNYRGWTKIWKHPTKRPRFGREEEEMNSDDSASEDDGERFLYMGLSQKARSAFTLPLGRRKR